MYTRYCHGASNTPLLKCTNLVTCCTGIEQRGKLGAEEDLGERQSTLSKWVQAPYGFVFTVTVSVLSIKAQLQKQKCFFFCFGWGTVRTYVRFSVSFEEISPRFQRGTQITINICQRFYLFLTIWCKDLETGLSFNTKLKILKVM